jgi:hypothetical protein
MSGLGEELEGTVPLGNGLVTNVGQVVPALQARGGKRLADKILSAFHVACDESELEIAGRLLQILEQILTRKLAPPDPGRRRGLEALVAAHERLWHLRHPQVAQSL